MWSTPEGRERRSVPFPEFLVNHANESPVAMTVTQQGTGLATLTLTPDEAWLASQDRQFPVTIDPTYASGPRRPCVTFEHVGRFGDHGRWHQSRRPSVTDCADASEVMNIGSVAGGDQRTRIDENHEREAGNSARRISFDRSARSGDAAKLPK